MFSPTDWVLYWVSVVLAQYQTCVATAGAYTPDDVIAQTMCWQTLAGG